MKKSSAKLTPKTLTERRQLLSLLFREKMIFRRTQKELLLTSIEIRQVERELTKLLHENSLFNVNRIATKQRWLKMREVDVSILKDILQYSASLIVLVLRHLDPLLTDPTERAAVLGVKHTVIAQIDGSMPRRSLLDLAYLQQVEMAGDARASARDCPLTLATELDRLGEASADPVALRSREDWKTIAGLVLPSESEELEDLATSILNHLPPRPELDEQDSSFPPKSKKLTLVTIR